MDCMAIITNEDNLYNAYRKSLSRRSYKLSAIEFNLDLFHNLGLLREELVTKSYIVSEYNRFYVKYPKLREILACTFKDKIVQHVVCDNILKKKLPEICIESNCAGQEGKGTSKARDILQEQLKEFHSKHHLGYVYRGDISKYYYSIEHQNAKDILEYYYDEEIHWLIEVFIDSTSGDVGVALGNQINTIVSNLYLEGLDRFITNELGIEYYGRFADDFYIIHHDKEYLKYCINAILEFLDTLYLTINPKSQINPLKNGIKYLGFHFYILENGEIFSKVLNNKANAYKKKFNKLYKKVLNEELNIDKLVDSLIAHIEHASYASEYKQINYYIKKMEELL